MEDESFDAEAPVNVAVVAEALSAMVPRNLSSKESKTLATEAALAAADVAEAEAFDSDVLAFDADVAALAAETFADAVAPSTVFSVVQ